MSLVTRSTTLTVIACTAAVACITFAMPARSASAATAPYYSSVVTTASVNMRPCVNLADPHCAPIGTTGAATRARMTCWRDGSGVTGRYFTNRWFLVELNTPGGPEGFIHASYVTSQTSVPECGTLARVRAVDWALGQVGQPFAPAEYGQGVWGMDWAPGPNREWSGDCAKLPFIAYKRQGLNYPLADAIRQWKALPDKRVASTGYLPRFGDPVFWDIARPWGHTALSVGGNKVVGTRGVDGNRRPVEIYPISDYSSYLGYAHFV